MNATPSSEDLPTTEPVIEAFMTRLPHTVGKEQPLAVAHRIMREANIRHLPVLEGGKLIGLLSARDLDFIETLHDVNPAAVSVEQAMTQEVCTVHPKESLRSVAKKMADHKYGSVVVEERGRVVGVFTTVDGMRALSNLLDANPN
jgi:acetoin utilization protein AcuB